MTPHLEEWLNLLLRWIHLTVGIAWIGASFYFNWLENNLNRLRGLREELSGNLWAIHGGGFYYLEKYKVAPKELPEELHWFKWEAYFTWLSGILLLLTVYYLNPAAYLVPPGSPAGAGVALGLGSLVAGWLIYELLCASPLISRGYAFCFVGFALLFADAWLLSSYLTPRAVYMHVGALLGTAMAGNVFRVIIPSQKALVGAASRGEAPDGALGLKALRRSRHNNYMTLPVLFVMLSNHFPSTYGHPHGLAVLAGLFAVALATRHYFNIRKQSPGSVWLLAVSLLGMAALSYLTAPAIPKASVPAGPPVEYSEVRKIIDLRCVSCHSQKPTDPMFPTAPLGILLDDDAKIKALWPRIRYRAVDSKTMPFANRSGMTEQEREVLGRFVP